MTYREIELKRCPFCGGEAEFLYSGVCTNIEKSECIVKCKVCESQTKTFYKRKEAAEQWNSRKYYRGVLLVEDGSVDVDECEELGFRPLVYRQGSALPIILKDEEKNA